MFQFTFHLAAVTEPSTSPRLLDTISIGEIVIAIAGLSVIVGAIRKVWPVLRRLAVLADAADWLPEVRHKLDTIHHELTPNGGGSINDAVKRIETRGITNEAAIEKVSQRLERHIDRDRGNTNRTERGNES